MAEDEDGAFPSRSSNLKPTHNTTPPFDWYSMRVVLAWLRAASTCFSPNLSLPRTGSVRKTARSFSIAAARARLSAPGRAASGEGMRMSAAAPALAVTVPADQSTSAPASGRTREEGVAAYAWVKTATATTPRRQEPIPIR